MAGNCQAIGFRGTFQNLSESPATSVRPLSDQRDGSLRPITDKALRTNHAGRTQRSPTNVSKQAEPGGDQNKSSINQSRRVMALCHVKCTALTAHQSEDYSSVLRRVFQPSSLPLHLVLPYLKARVWIHSHSRIAY